jgi:hypothetical protein
MVAVAPDVLNDILLKLDKVSHSGGGWKARCPAHDDREPSLSIKEGSDGRALLHCHAGCPPDEVVARLGLTMADLYPPEHKVVKPAYTNGHGNGNGMASPRPATRKVSHEYRAANGTLLATHIRYEDPVTGKKVGPMPWEPIGIKTPTLPLYRLAELLGAHPAESVILAEGEKACDTLREQGRIAVSLAGGASQRDFGMALEPLRGRLVYLWPDNDTPGRELMDHVAAALQSVAADVRRLEPMPLTMQPKDDAFDYFQDGGSVEMLEAMMRRAPAYAPSTIHDSRPLSEHEHEESVSGHDVGEGTPSQAPGFEPRAVMLTGMPEPAPRNFYVERLIPEGVVTTLYGDGGLGKSYVALYVAMLVALGRSFDGRAVTRSPVMYVDGELDQAEICRRAYQVARGMGLQNLPNGFYYYTLDGKSITEPDVKVRLAAEIEYARTPFIVLDSLTMSSYGGDPKDAPDMIKVVKYLESLKVGDSAVTTLAIDHIVGTNPNSNQSQYREYGSVFKRNAVRSSIQVVKATGGGLSLIHKKANFGPLQEPTNVVMSFEPGNVVAFRFVQATDDSMAGIGDHMPAIERVWLDLAGHKDGSTPDGLALALDITVGTVRNHLTALGKAHRADKLGDGRWVALHKDS